MQADLEHHLNEDDPLLQPLAAKRQKNKPLKALEPANVPHQQDTGNYCPFHKLPNALFLKILYYLSVQEVFKKRSIN